MFYVYLLKDKNDKFYIGFTKDLDRRLKEHKNSKVYTTKRMNQPALYYYEVYSDENKAKEREKKLKQFGSSYHGLIKRINK